MIINAKEVKEEIITRYDIICVDEAQRLYDNSISLILKLYDNRIIRGAVFANDFAQVLSIDEYKRNNPKRLNNVSGFKELNLSERIRINKELYSFIRTLLRLKDKANHNVEYKNVDILYANSDDEADILIDIYKRKDYKPIICTPSRYVKSSIDHYLRYTNSHEVIGQEFDYVLVIIDDSFRYDTNGDLTAKAHTNPSYLFQNYFIKIYQGLEKNCV